MPHPKRLLPRPRARSPPGSVLGVLAERTQLDFELEFFGKILASVPDFARTRLRVQACNLTMKGRLKDGLVVDEEARHGVRPTDPTGALQRRLPVRAALAAPTRAITTLRQSAVELGYRDFEFMLEDNDLDSIRKDPRFRKLVKEFKSS